jgi:hypothetical protein
MVNNIKTFNRLKKEAKQGVPYSVLKEKYPLMTKALYKKLSGINKIYRYNLENDVIKIITSDGLSQGSDREDLSAHASTYLIGSLFGDGHIEPVVENEYTNTYLYKVTHCWSQLNYIKYIYEVLKPYSSALTIKSPTRGLQDYHIQLTTITSNRLKKYRDIFYAASNNYKKDIMSKGVYSLLSWEALAYWIMDDGKSRGGRYCFSLCIGFQDHYTDNRMDIMSRDLSKKFGVSFKWKKDTNSYELYVLKRDSECVRQNLLPFIMPEFYYKFKAGPSELGGYYRNLPWFSGWQDKKLSIEHPLLSKVSYAEYASSSNALLKKRYEKSLFSRTVARGFPYIRLSSEDLLTAWRRIPLFQVKVSDADVLTCSPLVNSFSNHFMNHRYHCSKKNNSSPYSVYVDRKKLKKTLSIQLNSGPNINNSNIRNALATYSSSSLGVFNTGIARYLIEKYSINDNILDPCSGWGNRLCATVSLGKHYTGIEPSTKTYGSLLDIKRKIIEYGSSSSIKLVNSVAENALNYKENYYGCCITSPPYFDLEEYSYEPSQSYKKYSTYGEWCDLFLRLMINNVFKSLCNGGYFIINVGNVKGVDLIGSTKDYCRSAGFKIKKVYSLKPFRRPGMEVSWSEPVFIYQKR